MNNIKKTPNAHQDILQSFLYYKKNVAANTCSKIYNERMIEREKRVGEKWAA
jgi:hypothetical protein